LGTIARKALRVGGKTGKHLFGRAEEFEDLDFAQSGSTMSPDGGLLLM
jgi:hypothetical protein